ncbi:MAG: hypothetical protein EOM58_03730 [Clostridia bacterium]|nr:hypothetical protein [Clostridia bacterium]
MENSTGQTDAIQFSGKLTSLLARQPVRRTLNIVSGVWIVLLLLPLLLFCFYVQPSGDDFTHISPAMEAWAHTGSLGATLTAAWQRTLYMYVAWQGTWAGMFLSAFTPLVFGTQFAFLSPMLTLCLLAFSLWYTLRAVTRDALQLSWQATLFPYAVALTLWLAFLPGADDIVYWVSGVPYAISGAMVMLISGLLLRQHFGRARWPQFIALALCGAVLGGSTYPLALGGCVALLLVTLWSFIRRSKVRAGALLVLFITVASLIFVVVAPGNAVRQSRYGAPMQPLSAVVMGIAKCLQYTGTWVGPQWIAAALLLTVFLWQPLKNARLSFRNPALFTVLSFGALAAAFVPAIYATGVEGLKVDRVQASLYLAFVLLMLANILFWVGWLTSRMPKVRLTLTRWMILLSLILMGWGLFASAIMTTPVVASTQSLITGEAAAYSAASGDRTKAIVSAATVEEATDAAILLENKPVLLPDDSMTLHRDVLVLSIHRFYSIDLLMRQYQPGHIPKEAWDALDAWQ